MASRKRGLTDEEIRKFLQEQSDQSESEQSDDDSTEIDESDHLYIEEMSDSHTDMSDTEGGVVQSSSLIVSRNETEWRKVPPKTSKEK